MFRALRQSTNDHAVISKRARLQLDQVIESLPDTGLNPSMAVTRMDGGGARLWTLLNPAQSEHREANSDTDRGQAHRCSQLDLKTPIDLGAVTPDSIEERSIFSDDEIKDWAKPIKFKASACRLHCCFK